MHILLRVAIFAFQFRHCLCEAEAVVNSPQPAESLLSFFLSLFRRAAHNLFE